MNAHKEEICSLCARVPVVKSKTAARENSVNDKNGNGTCCTCGISDGISCMCSILSNLRRQEERLRAAGEGAREVGEEVGRRVADPVRGLRRVQEEGEDAAAGHAWAPPPRRVPALAGPGPAAPCTEADGRGLPHESVLQKTQEIVTMVRSPCGKDR